MSRAESLCRMWSLTMQGGGSNFQDTLKEAKDGDSSMQILVGQMYYNCYGVSRDTSKGRACFTRAWKSRLSYKRPGYHASD
ncbi:hypothetical protein IFM89_017908 [Coptis chinensis]|uniref:Uncharacterized protein n=1 Tax=Coptis chinensis TaxID=261450 RepID=A0A835J0T9_9MAGN|nr:hypothetical protein IFM89_017908 [Coptis chinensis]